ncbi:uncharacterized protein LOC119083548 [Bradysia coprophila]|uniref:uncharacterized protein LOC119083548 n=1 Tax=Bradysia coprophila TaxID=38358 RepID=UPI00187DC7BF|nr:uncharacterized protein LOC119083548 [Bradysia coprophila]
MESNYLSFAHQHHKLNWSNVLVLKFGKFQELNIWVAVSPSGAFNVWFSEDVYYEMDYLKVLKKIVLPYFVGNKDAIFLQEWNEITTSEIVRSWFKKHPEIQYITWPSNCEVAFPISLPWSDMKIRLKSHRPLCSLQAKSLIINFWKMLGPDFFTVARDGLKKIKDEHFNFARANFELDWNKVLFSKYGVVRCVSVWVAGTHLGPLDISATNGLLSEAHYIKILNDIVLPFLMQNRDVTYIQESNDVTKSEDVRSWFRMRPDIKCITWPPIVSPMSIVWDGINEHVDNNFALTSGEVTKFVLEFWEKVKNESPSYFPNSFTFTKQMITVIDK